MPGVRPSAAGRCSGPVPGLGLSPSVRRVDRRVQGLVRQLQVNNYRRKSASVTDVSVRPVWCRLAWTLPRYRAATAYRVPAYRRRCVCRCLGLKKLFSRGGRPGRGAALEAARGRNRALRSRAAQRPTAGRAWSRGVERPGSDRYVRTDEAMWECQIQFPKLSPRCEVSSSNNSCGIERAFQRPRARPRAALRSVFGPLRTRCRWVLGLNNYPSELYLYLVELLRLYTHYRFHRADGLWHHAQP